MWFKAIPVVSLMLQVVAGPHLLQVVTKTGLESYTARWGAVALAVTEGAEGEEEVCGWQAGWQTGWLVGLLTGRLACEFMACFCPSIVCLFVCSLYIH